ncbi:MAG: 1-acyl-sn-glycerol-3-phosphate acyltransferase [Prevotellaceae bacterium]|nr:1-acyl-sn-glycerol-3-phosphate acyltransferase [Prevotellaceae bacterium]
MKYLYRTYQLIIAAPVLLALTALTAIVTIIGCTLFNAHFWGYFPGCLWSRAFCRVLLLPVHTSGHENTEKHQSYVFVANHQGAFDIFMIYGYLGRNFKWLMKRSLRDIPLVGKACEKAGHIFVDKRGPKSIQHTYDNARKVLRNGTSVVVFPEGARSFTGHMGVFRKGAFQLAEELRLPVVPVTIDGSFQALPRTKGVSFVSRHTLRLTIHKPIPTLGREMRDVMQEAYQTIMSCQPKELQGFVENKDQ